MTNKFRENVKRSTVVRSAKEAKNGNCKTSEIVFMVLRSGKSSHCFFGSKDWQPCKSGNGKPVALGLDKPKARRIFSTLDKGCSNLAFRLFSGLKKGCGVSPDFLITRLLDAVISWFTKARFKRRATAV